MTQSVPPSLFLERRSYRRRRLMDALRLLPILGVMLFMLPLFWPSGDASGVAHVPMSRAVIYVFVAWLILIVCALGLWRGLWFATPPGAQDEASPEDTV